MRRATTHVVFCIAFVCSLFTAGVAQAAPAVVVELAAGAGDGQSGSDRVVFERRGL